MFTLLFVILTFGMPGHLPGVTSIQSSFETREACEAAGKALAEKIDGALVDGNEKPTIGAEFACAAKR